MEPQRKKRQSAGIRQGCPLSPYLFIIFQAAVMMDVHQILDSFLVGTGLHHFSKTELLYADDTVLIAKTARATTLLLSHIQREFAKYNMLLNQKKCVALIMNGKGRPKFKHGCA